MRVLDSAAAVPPARWKIVIPVKGTPSAKSRLGGGPALAAAIAMDTVTAVVEAVGAASVLVVTPASSAAAFGALGVALVDDPAAGLAAAVEAGVAAAATGSRDAGASASGSAGVAAAGATSASPAGAAAVGAAGAAAAGAASAGAAAAAGPATAAGPAGAAGAAAPAGPRTPVAVLLGDLPALTATELRAALVAAEAHPLAFVPDADGIGTTLITALDPAAHAPRFGSGSAALHRAAGYVPLGLPATSGLRRDVDTPADLAALIGRLGTATAAVAAAGAAAARA